MSVKCQGYMWHSCPQPAAGTLYELRSDRSWSAHDLCYPHFFMFCAGYKDEIDPPVEVEFHALASIGPIWTRDVR